MKTGDKIIWDSGFGYDLGYFISEDINIYNNIRCDMVTGVVHGVNSYSKSEVIPYIKEKHEEMNAKYSYHNNKTFRSPFNNE
jgi:hypothetical protein